MISYDFGMHRAGVFLHSLRAAERARAASVRAIGVNRPYLRGDRLSPA